MRGVTQYLHGLDLLFSCLPDLQGMQMIFSMLYLIWLIWQKIYKTLQILQKLVNSAGLMGLPFFNCRGPLTLGGTRAKPSVKGSGGQDCRGKVEGRGLVDLFTCAHFKKFKMFSESLEYLFVWIWNKKSEILPCIWVIPYKSTKKNMFFGFLSKKVKSFWYFSNKNVFLKNFFVIFYHM